MYVCGWEGVHEWFEWAPTELIVPFLEQIAKTLKPRLWWRYMARDEESQICFWLGLRPGDQIPGECIDANKLQGDGSDPGYTESTQFIPRSWPLVYHLLHLPFVTSFPPRFPASMELLWEYSSYLRKEISFFLTPPSPSLLFFHPPFNLLICPQDSLPIQHRLPSSLDCFLFFSPSSLLLSSLYSLPSFTSEVAIAFDWQLEQSFLAAM